MSTKPTLLLLPGLLCDETAFAHQFSALADICDVVVPGFRGLDSMQAMARKALEAAPPKFALAGFSMGGRAAFEVMRIAGDRVEKLCLFDTSARPEPAGGAGARQRLVDLAYNDGMEALAHVWLPPMLAKARREDTAFQKPLLDMICRSTPEQHEKQIRALVTRPDPQPLLAAITCPTLLVCGEEDAFTPVSAHAGMAQAIPGGQLTVIANAGHFACYEQPQAFNAALRMWLMR